MSGQREGDRRWPAFQDWDSDTLRNYLILNDQEIDDRQCRSHYIRTILQSRGVPGDD